MQSHTAINRCEIYYEFSRLIETQKEAEGQQTTLDFPTLYRANPGNPNGRHFYGNSLNVTNQILYV
jgi:hypothetical protein